MGETFYVDPTGYTQSLFDIKYMKSSINTDMNNPGLRYYHLWDEHPNTNGLPSRVGKVFPDLKTIIFDDEEIVAALSYKSNRNWTLPAPSLSLVTPNVCDIDNNDLSNVYEKIFVYNHYLFKDDTIKTIRNKISCSIKMNPKFGSNIYLTPSRLYLWSEYIINNKVEKFLYSTY
jgi:hypothetical protein